MFLCSVTLAAAVGFNNQTPKHAFSATGWVFMTVSERDGKALLFILLKKKKNLHLLIVFVLHFFLTTGHEMVAYGAFGSSCRVIGFPFA